MGEGMEEGHTARRYEALSGSGALGRDTCSLHHLAFPVTGTQNVLSFLSGQSSIVTTGTGWRMWPVPIMVCLGSVVTGQHGRARGQSQLGLGMKGGRGWHTGRWNPCPKEPPEKG